MPKQASVIVYSQEPNFYITLKDNKRIKITKQKTDTLLHSFSYADSQSTRFVELVSNDPVLRTLFFLKNISGPNLHPKYPTQENYPIMLSPEYDIFTRLIEGYAKDKENVEKQCTDLNAELKETYSSVSYQTFISLLKDEEVTRSLTKRPYDLQKAIDHSFERHKEEIMDLYSSYADKLLDVSHSYSLLTDVMSYLENVETARNNGDILSRVKHLPDQASSFFSSLNRLASENIVTIETQSLCLDCYFKYKDEPYKASNSNIKTINLPIECPRCKEKGVFHNLILNYPLGLHKLILPETNWLQEILVGYSLKSLESVDKIFVHKKIHNAPQQQNESSGIESDVSIITNDGRLVLIEVTTLSRFDNIIEAVSRKISNLEERDIPFSSIGFITPYTMSDRDEFLTFGKKNAKIFMAKHIQKLPEFVEEELIKKS